MKTVGSGQQTNESRLLTMNSKQNTKNQFTVDNPAK